VCKACTLKLHFLSGADDDKVALRFCLDCVADARSVAGRYSCSDASTTSSSVCVASNAVYGAPLRHTSSMASISPVLRM
jgi:hypothetical protein